ncbi:MAG: 2-amino-4-hydroxy-6-hydroxymethyldihydropteridine diphosphokinase [Akkermansiaceae bacterium]
MPRVAIALGSNLGDRKANIAAAIKGLRNLSTEGEPFLTAKLYDTSPQDCPPESPRFLNTAVDFHYTGDNPLTLLEQTQHLEQSLGRESNPIRNSPRIIDIDILLFGDQTLRDPRLEIPHPRIRERPFVLLPLREVRPEFS